MYRSPFNLISAFDQMHQDMQRNMNQISDYMNKSLQQSMKNINNANMRNNNNTNKLQNNFIYQSQSFYQNQSGKKPVYKQVRQKLVNGKGYLEIDDNGEKKLYKIEPIHKHYKLEK